MATYSVCFQVSTDEQVGESYLEDAIQDLIKVAVAPALDLEFNPITFSVRKSYS